MAGYNFRPAGISDDEDDSSDGDDFMRDYKATKQPVRSLDLGKRNQMADNVVDKSSSELEKQDNIPPARPSLGKSVLPLDDFRHAAMKGDLEAIKLCLKQGISPDQQLTTGWTALMYAGTNVKYDAMKFLIENGADVNYHCNHYSVLMATCGNGKYVEDKALECVQLLIEKKVEVNAFDRHHTSALMYASKAGRPNVVQKLLDSGANTDKQDNRGYTALHWACYKGHVMVVQILKEGGADLSKKTSDGSLPRDIAYENGKQRICNILNNATNGHHAVRSSGDEIMQNSSHLHNGSVPEKEKTDPLIQVIGSSSNISTYGDLEVYLSGLELSQYIEVFQRNRVTFQAFLRMTDHDLKQLGIHQMGHRKKILDSIHATHKRDWESSSLASVQYNKQLKCSDAIAIISNINKHTSYISSTIGYITDQVKAHPEILRSGQDGSSVEDLMAKSTDGFVNVSNLYQDLTELHRYLNKVSDIENFDPPELIRREPKQYFSLVSPKNVLISILGISASMMLWKSRTTLITQFSKN